MWGESTHSWKPPDGAVYFIQAAGGGPVKIGFSVDVATRLNELQIASPYELRVLLTVPGSWDVEQALHRRFRAHRLRGEWFRPAQEIFDYISGQRGGNPA